MTEIDRRDFLSSLMGAAASLPLADIELLREAAKQVAAAPREAPFRTLTPQQARDLDAFAAQILPTTDTPGAREAHAVRYIDHVLSTFWKDRRLLFNDITSELSLEVERHVPGTKSLADLSDAQQIDVMKAFEKNRPNLFANARAHLLVGVFAHPKYGGNANKVGWKLLGFEDRFAWSPPYGFYDRT